MYSVEIYNKVCLACHHHDMSQSEAARQFGVARKTIRKILSHAEPPGYRRIVQTHLAKLGGFTDLVGQILKDDKSRPKK